MAQFAVNIMCPSERGPPTMMGLFSSAATKRSAAHNYDYVPGNIIVAYVLENPAKIVESMFVTFRQGLLSGVRIGPMKRVARAHATQYDASPQIPSVESLYFDTAISRYALTLVVDHSGTVESVIELTT
jgi:hypothetical protein